MASHRPDSALLLDLSLDSHLPLSPPPLFYPRRCFAAPPQGSIIPSPTLLCEQPDMVKAPSSQYTSSCRPAFPSTLSLASISLKPGKPSLFVRSFLEKRPPLLAQAEPMDPSSSSRSSASTADSLDDASSMDNASLLLVDRHQASKSAEAPSFTEEDAASREEDMGSPCGRQRLQQHRIQMGGKVIIPEAWGREQQLQEWVSYGIVEDALRPAGLMSARSALVSDCQRREKKPVRTSPPISADVEVS